MHDVNKSGWYQFIPIYGIILLITAGTEGTNDYGEDPKTAKIEDDDLFSKIFASALLASFISCAVYALLSQTHIVDNLRDSESFKNNALIISFIASLVFFLFLSLRKEDEKLDQPSQQKIL